MPVDRDQGAPDGQRYHERAVSVVREMPERPGKRGWHRHEPGALAPGRGLHASLFAGGAPAAITAVGAIGRGVGDGPASAARSHHRRPALPWRPSPRTRRAAGPAAVLLALGLCWVPTYVIGGASVVPPLWFFVPILLAGVRLGYAGAVATALASAVLAGPLTPDDVVRDTAQLPSDWLLRGAFFVGIGVVMAGVTQRLQAQTRASQHAHRRSELAATELQGAVVALEHQSLHDGLTGLGNRGLLARLTGARELDGHALVLVDLDQFKAINDTLGHTTGDRVLGEVARRLRDAVRPGDALVRLGGDEFGVLLAGADAAVGRTIAERILCALQRPFELDGRPIFVGARAGIAVAAAGGTIESLMREADASMHHAKCSAGAEPIAVFDPKRDHATLERLALAHDLRGALARDELVLHYQPIVELASRHAVGYEALLRWRHPERGLVAPGAFIALAEHGGLMPEIGEWVLRRACLDAGRWSRDPASRPYVSVNLSVSQLQEARFLERFGTVLELAGLPAGQLVVEVTETAMAADLEAISRPLETLRRLGVRVHVDDFGTGYSSLGYIRDLPLDGVKLDRSFTRDVTTSEDAWAITRAVVVLLAKMKLTLTAEGIESVASLAQLRSVGCVHGQGFYFGRPQPIERLGAPPGAHRP